VPLGTAEMKVSGAGAVELRCAGCGSWRLVRKEDPVLRRAAPSAASGGVSAGHRWRRWHSAVAIAAVGAAAVITLILGVMSSSVGQKHASRATSQANSATLPAIAPAATPVIGQPVLTG
jgi:hypothetical protein